MPKLLVTLCFFLATAAWASAYAEEDDTMMIVEAGDEPRDIVNVIKLPQFVAPAATDKTGLGAKVAEEAKALEQELGQQTAEEAQARGRALAEDVRNEVAEEARRDKGRGRGRD